MSVGVGVWVAVRGWGGRTWMEREAATSDMGASEVRSHVLLRRVSTRKWQDRNSR